MVERLWLLIPGIGALMMAAAMKLQVMQAGIGIPEDKMEHALVIAGGILVIGAFLRLKQCLIIAVAFSLGKEALDGLGITPGSGVWSNGDLIADGVGIILGSVFLKLLDLNPGK